MQTAEEILADHVALKRRRAASEDQLSKARKAFEESSLLYELPFLPR